MIGHLSFTETAQTSVDECVDANQRIAIRQGALVACKGISQKPSQVGRYGGLPLSFFCRPAEVVAPELIGCSLVKRQSDGVLLFVETEAYSQVDPACHGYRRRSPQNETLQPKREVLLPSPGGGVDEEDQDEQVRLL